jgi:hypothetical protein
MGPMGIYDEHLDAAGLSICDWCLREVDNRHRVDHPIHPGDYDLVCRDCDPDEVA